MHLRPRAAGAIPVALAATLVALATVTASAATPQPSAAASALRYLYGQVASNGGVASSAGVTEDTVISTADNGYDPGTLHGSGGTTSYAYLASQQSSITTAGGAAKMVLAWLAAGRPAAFDSQALLDKLNTPTGSGGYLSTQGTFHNANPATETANSYSQSFGILADVAANAAGLHCNGSVGACPLPPTATSWLLCAQRPDGGFGYAINDSAVPPAFCGDTSSDTNDTSIVLQALGAAGVTTADSAAATYLHGTQNSDGGFGFAAGSGSDPDSDTTVIQALVAIGQDPTAAAWTKSSKTALSNLVSFADAANGGYIFPGNASPDAFTTAPVPQALALKSYGATTTFTAGASPAAAATPSTTPSATASSVPVPSTGAAAPGSPVMPAAGLLVASGALVLVTLLATRRRPRRDIP